MLYICLDFLVFSHLILQIMHLLPISLLTILAGTLLLAKFKKEMPGKFFNYIAWFFVVVGFILFIGFIGGGIFRMTHRGCPGPMGFRHEMMMKKCGPGMHHPGCCMPGMERGMCTGKPGCMPHDSMMKCCPKHMMGDSVKMAAPKK
jgi:hypothetical protein